MVPVFLNSVEQLRDSYPDLTTVIPVAPNHHVESYIDRAIYKFTVPTILIPGCSQSLKYDAFGVCSLCQISL